MKTKVEDLLRSYKRLTISERQEFNQKINVLNTSGKISDGIRSIIKNRVRNKIKYRIKGKDPSPLNTGATGTEICPTCKRPK